MKELDFIEIIKKQSASEYIGDDCAFVKELGFVITQDSLVEDVHFKREWYSPYQLGYKSATVNISDILASGAVPAFLMVSLSLPNYIDSDFVEEFYKGLNNASLGAKIIGGDITGSSNKIFISITAIGKTSKRRVSSRKNAKAGYAVITTGEFGSSAKGLYQLLSNNIEDNDFVQSHLMPNLNKEFSEQIATNINCDYAMMDTSDGLMDALFKIAQSSNVTLDIDYNLVPRKDDVEDNFVLFGGEDYNLVACVPNDILKFINDYVKIGNVVKKVDDIWVKINGKSYSKYDELSVYNHFGG